MKMYLDKKRVYDEQMELERAELEKHGGM